MGVPFPVLLGRHGSPYRTIDALRRDHFWKTPRLPHLGLSRRDTVVQPVAGLPAGIQHSLGYRQVIEAPPLLRASARAHETYLFAPACLEDEAEDKLVNLARGNAWLYYTHLDHLLDISFRAMSQGRALGAVGPERNYDGLIVHDVSEEFDFWVHTEYKNRFGHFSRADA